MPSLPKIPFNDLSRTPADVSAAIEAAVSRVLASGWYVMGPEHDAFETELASYLGAAESVLVGNGTDALEIALAVVGVERGGVILATANAGGYGTIAGRLLGAEVYYSDVSPETLQMTPETFLEALERVPATPKAVIVTHLFGAMADVAAITLLARERGIAVVEDCAQSLGAESGGIKAGLFGDIATTSFYPTKNLGALGDGGALFTNSAELAEKARRMRQYGWKSKYHIAYDHGRNSRLDEMQAAILRVKLPFLDAANERRRAIHARYLEASSDGVRVIGATSPSFIAHLAVVLADDRDRVREVLNEAGVATDIHYPVPDHHQTFPSSPPAPVSLPITERVAETLFSVPMFPELTDDEVDRICAALRRAGE